METQTGKKLKKFHVDRGGEFINQEFKDFLAESGMELEITAAYSPAQNGIVERLNQTLVEHARAMMFNQNVPRYLWPEAVAYACYLKNQSPTQALAGMTPYEAFSGKKPDVSVLQQFGQPCWVLNQGTDRDKEPW